MPSSLDQPLRQDRIQLSCDMTRIVDRASTVASLSVIGGRSRWSPEYVLSFRRKIETWRYLLVFKDIEECDATKVVSR